VFLDIFSLSEFKSEVNFLLKNLGTELAKLWGLAVMHCMPTWPIPTYAPNHLGINLGLL